VEKALFHRKGVFGIGMNPVCLHRFSMAVHPEVRDVDICVVGIYRKGRTFLFDL